MTQLRHIRAIAFDMGGTLFHEDYAATRSLRTTPFAEHVLEQLSHYATLVVATNSNYSEGQIGNLLERLHIRPYFSHIFTSQTVVAMKPQPHYFEFMLRELALAPDQVIMVGDTYLQDIAGAKRAGLWTIWLTGSASEAPDADAVISGLRGAPPAIAWIDGMAADAAEQANRPRLP
jgi:HAD superfamily hydrolase (TIGR01662 family)